MLTKTPSFQQSLPRSGIAGGCRNPASMDGKPQVTAGLAVSSKLHILSDRSYVPAFIVIHNSSHANKHRHFGMDAEIQAMDGNLTVERVLHLGDVVRQSLPSLDAGFRHPCRSDGFPAFVYNDERTPWERSQEETQE